MINKYLRFLDGKAYKAVDYARSPLDIPGKTILYALLTAITFCFVAGLLFCWLLYQLSLSEATSYNLGYVNSSSTERYPLVEDILADWSRSWPDLDSASQAVITANLGDTISIKTLAALTKKNTDGNAVQALTKKVAGDFNPLYFSQTSAENLADHFGLTKDYSSDPYEKSLRDWKRALFIASVQRVRGDLSENILKPRRLLQALLGPIQWITFVSAVWCLILLLALRKPWAKIQLDLVESGKLDFLESKDTPNIWEGSNYTYLQNVSQRKYLAVRLISEVKNVETTTTESLYNLITDRVNAFRDSVEVGEYEIVNFLIWAAPTFGFIGTIYGIISAMEKAGAILSKTDRLAQAEALNQISASLGTAFDTSLIALVWLVPMSFALARTRKMESNLFEELEEKAVRTFLPSTKKS